MGIECSVNLVIMHQLNPLSDEQNLLSCCSGKPTDLLKVPPVTIGSLELKSVVVFVHRLLPSVPPLLLLDELDEVVNDRRP
jgi:hypothetical protein